MKGVLIFLLVVIYTPLYAQFLVGPKVGVQMSKVTYEDEDYRKDNKTYFKPGFNAGLVLNYKVNQTFSLHTELYYSRKGKIEKNSDYGVKNVASYHYIDLPMLLRVSKHTTIKKQRVEYYFNVGPSFGYWMGGKGRIHSDEFYEFFDKVKLDYTIKFDTVSFYGEHEFVPNPNRLQLEINLGGGLVFEMGGKERLMIDLRYGFGIGHTFLGEKNGGDFGLVEFRDNFEAVNQVLSVSVAYLYEFNLMQTLKKGKTIKKSTK